MRYECGQLIDVRGEVKYGRTYYRVASLARVLTDYGNGWVQVVLSEIDGDREVIATVRKRITCPLDN